MQTGSLFYTYHVADIKLIFINTFNFMLIKLGADALNISLVGGKKVGLISNTASFLASGNRLDKLVKSAKSLTLFAPEHGVGLQKKAGEIVDNEFYKGLKVVSLYGQNQAIESYLDGIDVVLYDLQDVGVRFYTYISTLKASIAAANKKGKEFYVLDRPNPLSGCVDGTMLKKGFESFVGAWEVPIRYGLTAGELAMYGQKFGLYSKVVKMEGWKIGDWFDQTGLIWAPPSPAIKTLYSALIYSGMGLIEGTNLSEGRGTDEPFMVYGAPWLNETPKIDETGFALEPAKFIPAYDKYSGELCKGFRIKVVDRKRSSFDLAAQIISWAANYKEFEFLKSGNIYKIDLLSGTDEFRKAVLDDKLDDYKEKWRYERETFLKEAQPYMIYRRRIWSQS